MVVALSHFISKSSEWCHNFFNTLKKNTDFIWMEECEEALIQLKSYLNSTPLLSKPLDGKTLFVYLAVSEHAVNTALVCKDKGKQSPVYYVSKALLDAESQYSQLEKLALALIMAARKLRPYFQSDPISRATLLWS